MWQPKDQLEPMQCPVCKSLLGKRDKHQIFIAHCDECKATFHWKPRAIKPNVTMDSAKHEGCNCGICGR